MNAENFKTEKRLSSVSSVSLRHFHKYKPRAARLGARRGGRRISPISQCPTPLPGRDACMWVCTVDPLTHLGVATSPSNLDLGLHTQLPSTQQLLTCGFGAKPDTSGPTNDQAPAPAPAICALLPRQSFLVSQQKNPCTVMRDHHPADVPVTDSCISSSHACIPTCNAHKKNPSILLRAKRTKLIRRERVFPLLREGLGLSHPPSPGCR